MFFARFQWSRAGAGITFPYSTRSGKFTILVSFINTPLLVVDCLFLIVLGPIAQCLFIAVFDNEENNFMLVSYLPSTFWKSVLVLFWLSEVPIEVTKATLDPAYPYFSAKFIDSFRAFLGNDMVIENAHIHTLHVQPLDAGTLIMPKITIWLASVILYIPFENVYKLRTTP